jgi:hypothetical protein
VIWSTASCIRASVLNVLPMKKVKRAPMTQLPATFVEAEAVDAVAHWFDLTDAMLRTENSRLVMRAYLKRLIRQGTIPTLRVIGWANSGSEEADKALREIAAEMLDAGESPPANIRYYAASALIQPSQVKRGKGNDAAENWLRDQCIADRLCGHRALVSVPAGEPQSSLTEAVGLLGRQRRSRQARHQYRHTTRRKNLQGIRGPASSPPGLAIIAVPIKCRDLTRTTFPKKWISWIPGFDL